MFPFLLLFLQCLIFSLSPLIFCWRCCVYSFWLLTQIINSQSVHKGNYCKDWNTANFCFGWHCSDTPWGMGWEHINSTTQTTGDRWVTEHAADLFITDVWPAYICLIYMVWPWPPKVPLAQAVNSVTLSFLGMSRQVSLHQQSLGLAAGLRLTQKGSTYQECSCGLVWQDGCGLDRLASSFSYVFILYLFIYLRNEA